MDIEVGEWIKDKEGNVTKIIGKVNLDRGVYLYLGEDGYQYNDNCIDKHGKERAFVVES